MKPNFYNQATASFILWLDHQILDKGLAYQNVSGALFQATDNKYFSSKVYSSPYAQWVADTSISGANVPTGVFVNNVLNGRGTNGLKLNFQEGKALFGGSFTGTNVTASYAVKDFNIYLTNEDDTSILFKNKFTPKPKVPQELGALPTDALVFPCIFVKFNVGENKPFAFGGMDSTNLDVRVHVLSDDVYKLEAVLGILQDSAQKCFPVISNSNLPFNIYGDLKSGDYYNYTQLAGFMEMNIDKVKTYKLPEMANQAINPRCFVGYADFKLLSYRYPRI